MEYIYCMQVKATSLDATSVAGAHYFLPQLVLQDKLTRHWQHFQRSWGMNDRPSCNSTIKQLHDIFNIRGFEDPSEKLIFNSHRSYRTTIRHCNRRCGLILACVMYSGKKSELHGTAGLSHQKSTSEMRRHNRPTHQTTPGPDYIHSAYIHLARTWWVVKVTQLVYYQDKAMRSSSLGLRRETECHSWD